jgi:HAD superfamily hydrolase (TIGR01509 family)
VARAFLFDLDGVLINSAKLMRYAFTEGVRRLLPGVEAPLEAFLAESGNSLPNVIKKLGFPMELVEEFRQISMANLHMIEVVDGIYEVLNTLQAAQVKMGLVTGKEKDRTIQILKLFHLQHYFRAIVSPEDVQEPKPAPDSYQKALALLKSQASEAVSFGDAPNDILASRKAGVVSVGVSWGLFGGEVLRSSGAAVIIDSPQEMLRFHQAQEHDAETAQASVAMERSRFPE